MRCLPGAQAEGSLPLGDFRSLAAGISVPVISCLPRQGAAETVAICWHIAHVLVLGSGRGKVSVLKSKLFQYSETYRAGKYVKSFLGGQGSTVLKQNAFAL